MQKYVIFFNNNKSKVVSKSTLTPEIKNDLKKNGFRKHHIEIEAENEQEVLLKLKEFNDGYFESLRGLTGSAVICAIAVIAVALLYMLRS